MTGDNKWMFENLELGVRRLCSNYDTVLFDTTTVLKPEIKTWGRLSDLVNGTIKTEGVRKVSARLAKFRSLIETYCNFTTIIPIREEVQNGAKIFKHARGFYKENKKYVKDYSNAMDALSGIIADYSDLITKIEERITERPQQPASKDIAKLLEKIFISANITCDDDPPSKTDYMLAAEMFALQMCGKRTAIISNDFHIGQIAKSAINIILNGGLVQDSSVFNKIRVEYTPAYYVNTMGHLTPFELCESQNSNGHATGNTNQLRKDIAEIEKAYAQQPATVETFQPAK